MRLTAPDGYTAARSYSIASAPDGGRVELTVEVDADGEVSPYLARDVAVGDQLEMRGPLGGWFVWRPAADRAGAAGRRRLGGRAADGDGARARDGGQPAPLRLLYSVRTAGGGALRRRAARRAGALDGVDVPRLHPRGARRLATPARPRGRRPARGETWSPGCGPDVYVCGPTAFVETVADLLVAAGHDPSSIRTERFGSGGTR